MYLERLDQVTQRAIVAVFSRTKHPGREMRASHTLLRAPLMADIEREWMNVTGLERHMFLFNVDAIMGAWVDWRKMPKKNQQEWYKKHGSPEPLFPDGPGGKGPGDVPV